MFRLIVYNFWHVVAAKEGSCGTGVRAVTTSVFITAVLLLLGTQSREGSPSLYQLIFDMQSKGSFARHNTPYSSCCLMVLSPQASLVASMLRP